MGDTTTRWESFKPDLVCVCDPAGDRPGSVSSMLLVGDRCVCGELCTRANISSAGPVDSMRRRRRRTGMSNVRADECSRAQNIEGREHEIWGKTNV